MGSDITPLKEAAEQFQGQTMANLLKDIPNQEHLGIIRQLAAAEKGNPALKFDIDPGSTPDHYKYSITHNTAGQDNSHYGVQLPAGQAEAMAKTMGMSVDDFNKMMKQGSDQAAASVTASPILHEEFSAAPNWHSTTASNEKAFK